MNQFVSFIRKEYYHISRDKLTLSIMLVLPIVLLLILGYAISTEFNNTRFAVLDLSKSQASTQLIEQIDKSSYFSLIHNLKSERELEPLFKNGDVKAILVIPTTFNQDLIKQVDSEIQLLLDASDPNEAMTIENYFQQIVRLYSANRGGMRTNSIKIIPEVKMLYNPQMKSAYNFVPGLFGLLMMLICAMMTSISVVKEKEMGTMEILLVSPLKPTTIILSKALLYLVIALVDVLGILLLAHFLMGVPIVGSLFLILLLSLLFTFSALALGLLISSVVDTQQSAMLISAVGLLLPSILLSGMIFPLENMPLILQWISCIIPARWFIEALRNVMIQGLGITAIWQEVSILLFITVFLLFVSIKSFKNRL